ncbi:MAG: adenylosuccinate synthase [Chloroflexota bacterium]
MSVTAVVGAQWGDEGKGRIVDYLAQKEPCTVIRFQGGDNAGHTVINDYGKHVLHLIPCGIFNPDAHNIIGSGCVVNPQVVLQELTALENAGVQTENLWISNRAQMLMPYHPILDELEESMRADAPIGTTQRGVGPAYADKATRSGLRMGDLLQPEWLEARLDQALETVNHRLQILGGHPVDGEALYATCLDYRAKLGHRIIDTTPLLRQSLDEGRAIFLEGQLGVMRDLDWGIYPYVTSSNPTASFATSGAGLPARSLDQVVGVVKAFSSCVGDGPFPVELSANEAARLRELGGEFGATTGRARRMGWFDGVAIRYAAWLNGMSSLALTKLDILDHYDRLKICVGYQLSDGSVVTNTMPETALLTHAKPLYEEWEGWQVPTTECRRWADLPSQAKAYVSRISELANVKVSSIAVGPERSQMFEVGE